jgi:lysine 2,3-aminomutase
VRAAFASLRDACYTWFAMKFVFEPTQIPAAATQEEWNDWAWHLRHSLKSETDFMRAGFSLSDDERRGFEGGGKVFQIRTTPYYASLASKQVSMDPIRRILMPTAAELSHDTSQAMLDPLGERKNNPAPRIIHRYPDRLLFLVTDTCSVYCRYCTRKHFTGQDEAFVRSADYDRALSYIRSRTGIREVILNTSRSSGSGRACRSCARCASHLYSRA